MNWTTKPDLRTVADVTRAINQVSLHPTVTGVQRLINLEVKADLLCTRARFKDARSTQVSPPRGRVLQREAQEDRRLAAGLRRQYVRLTRKSRGYERSGATCD